MENRFDLKEWFRAERKKLAGCAAPEIMIYIWDYYRLWLLGLVAALVLGGFVGYRLLCVPGENWFCACFANTFAELGEGTAFYKGFAARAGYDLKEKNLVFNAETYCNPAKSTFGNTYYEALVALIDSGTLDVLVMEEADITALGAQGRLLDLRDERMGPDFAARWQDRFVTCRPIREDTDRGEAVPVGIDLAGSRLVGEYRAYPAGAVLALGASLPHPDQVELFLDYIFEEDAP